MYHIERAFKINLLQGSNRHLHCAIGCFSRAGIRSNKLKKVLIFAFLLPVTNTTLFLVSITEGIFPVT